MLAATWTKISMQASDTPNIDDMSDAPEPVDWIKDTKRNKGNKNKKNPKNPHPNPIFR